MLLLSRIEKERYVPAGKRTVPPPALAAASIARLTAGESSAWPSPRAPNDFTLKTPAASACCAATGTDPAASVARRGLLAGTSAAQASRKGRATRSGFFGLIVVSGRGLQSPRSAATSGGYESGCGEQVSTTRGGGWVRDTVTA